MTYCQLSGDPGGGGGGGGGGEQTGIYADLGVFGTDIQSQLTGSLLEQTCVLTGAATVPIPSIGDSVLGGADVRVCPGGGATVAFDTNPHDFKRVRVTLTWNNGRSSLSQTTLIPNPASV